MKDKLYTEFREQTKELQRLRSIYRKRAKRAKAAGLFKSTYLSQINNITLGYKVNTKDKVTIEKDNFSAKEFKAMSEYDKKQMIIQAEKKVKYLKNALANPMSSLKGVKDFLKKELKTEKLDMNSAQVRAKLDNFQKNPEGAFKHANTTRLMDAIDARADLTDDEKTAMKNLIRTRLTKGEKVTYDSWFIQWEVDIGELLEDPKKFIDQLAKDIEEDKLRELIPEQVVQRLLDEASRLETTDDPARTLL